MTIEETGSSLQRLPRSLLRWSNLTRNSTYGDTYLWTQRGCARAIVSIYAIGPPENQISLEFQSLSELPLIARRGETVIWNPQQPGVEFVALDDVSVPGKSPARRLARMNAIARSFRAEFAPHVSPGEFSELRLLSKPLYRYQSQDPKVLDGAVYGFVESTDPETLLIIEARADGDSLSWVYSGARSRHDHLRLYRHGELVWDREPLAPPWENMKQPDGTYFNVRWEAIAAPDEHSQLDELFEVRPATSD